MIKINAALSSKSHYLAASAIAQISDTDAASQYRGIRSVIKTFDGDRIESNEPASVIAAQVDEELLKLKS